MMAYYATQRIADGLIVNIEQRNTQPPNLIAKAVAVHGGTPEDWQVVELTQTQYDAAFVGGVNAYLNAGTVTTKRLTISADKETVTALLEGEPQAANLIIITADTGEGGELTTVWEVITPSGAYTTETETTSAGVASLTLDTSEIGTHTVACSIRGYGRNELTFEAE